MKKLVISGLFKGKNEVCIELNESYLIKSILNDNASYSIKDSESGWLTLPSEIIRESYEQECVELDTGVKSKSLEEYLDLLSPNSSSVAIEIVDLSESHKDFIEYNFKEDYMQLHINNQVKEFTPIEAKVLKILYKELASGSKMALRDSEIFKNIDCSHSHVSQLQKDSKSAFNEIIEKVKNGHWRLKAKNPYKS